MVELNKLSSSSTSSYTVIQVVSVSRSKSIALNQVVFITERWSLDIGGLWDRIHCTLNFFCSPAVCHISYLHCLTTSLADIILVQVVPVCSLDHAAAQVVRDAYQRYLWVAVSAVGRLGHCTPHHHTYHKKYDRNIIPLPVMTPYLSRKHAEPLDHYHWHRNRGVPSGTMCVAHQSTHYHQSTWCPSQTIPQREGAGQSLVIFPPYFRQEGAPLPPTPSPSLTVALC